VPRLPAHFFKTGSGTEAVRDWLKEMSQFDRRTIGEDIRTVQIGWPLGMPVVRKMEANLWEVRCDIGHGIARVLFTVKSQTIVLLHGFIKKTAATPKRELDVARARMKEVQSG
jgi:phage-related protein